MSWAPEEVDEFVAFCRHIQSHGTVEPRPAPAAAIYHNKYLVIGDHKFWAMGPNRDRDAVRADDGHQPGSVLTGKPNLSPSRSNLSDRFLVDW